GSQIPKELEADEFSGSVLRRMGASLQQAQLAMKLIASPYASATHPGENDRLAAIARGWNSTTVQTNRANTDVAISTPVDRRTTSPNTYPQTYPSPNGGKAYPAPSDERNNYPSTGNGRNYPSSSDSRGDYPNNDSRRYGRRNNDQGNTRGGSLAIVYDIRFNGSNAQQYYITAQNQVIMLRGNRAMVVAKIAATNNANYPYVIYDDHQQIYIDRKGNLFTENSRRSIGYVARHNS
ncbi:MAG: hypothetical protein JWQ09_5588, partial [Segetibacter sp.]|nr:hypothetical protein [Segetibacter sp.]